MKKSGSTTGLAKIGVRFGGLPNILTGLFDNQKNNLSKSKSCSSPNLLTSRPDREINDEHNRMFKRAKSAFEETRRIFQQNDEKSLSKPQKTEGKKTTKPHPTGHWGVPQFGITLPESIQLQQPKFPERTKLPWILTALCQKIIKLNGTTTRGIFRIEAEKIGINTQREYLSKWDSDKITSCHTAACLLKQWLRELKEPLIPNHLYEEAIDVGQRTEEDESPEKTVTEFVGQMRVNYEPNYWALLYLVKFLRIFAAPKVAAQTGMNDDNLATIFAPNVMRSPPNMEEDAVLLLTRIQQQKRSMLSLIKWLEIDNADGCTEFRKLNFCV